MTAAQPLSPTTAETIKTWRQGDCVRAAQEFVYLIDPSQPLSPEARGAVQIEPTTEWVSAPMDGLMVVSQSCDIVRDALERSFVEIAPLRALPEDIFQDVVLGHRPQFATVPALHPFREAADLDMIVTAEKSLLAKWSGQNLRLVGCETDKDRRILASQLARKRNRAALPDDFRDWFKPLQKRMKKVSKAQNDEGRTFRDLLEVRVQPTPNWNACHINVFVWFVLDDDSVSFDRSQVLSDWTERLIANGRFARGRGRFVHYEDMNAAEYLDSDTLDLERLSPETIKDSEGEDSAPE